MERISKTWYYLNIAREVAGRGTCLRRNFGSVIVNDDRIISTGYTGAPRGTLNCVDIGACYREKMGVPNGERYDLCRSVHAEMNAIIQAAPYEMVGSTMYVVGIEAITNEVMLKFSPCRLCKGMIINAGISKVTTQDGEDEFFVYSVQQWIDQNLDYFTKVDGKLVPNILKGY